MAPSVAASSHPYVGRTADTPAKQAASLFTENMIYVAFYMGSCFPSIHTDTRSHTSQDDSYNCRDRKSTKSLVQKGGGSGRRWAEDYRNGPQPGWKVLPLLCPLVLLTQHLPPS